MTAVPSAALPLVAAAVLWGAAAGASLPRAAYRFSVPSGETWRDRCPAGHSVRGWIGRGRCEQCAAATPAGAAAAAVDGPAAASAGDRAVTSAVISYGPRTLPMSLVTALVCGALAAATGVRPELVVWLLLAPVGVLLAVVDFRVRRLPDVLTLPLAGAALALLGPAALVPGHAGHWPTALYGALALGGGYFVLFLVNPAGMGFGDVKLALGAGAVLGWYGWPVVLLGTFAGFLFGALYGGALVAVRRAGRKTAIAFGPFLVAGAFVGALIGAYAA
ncbi:prepilin peptidase [Streptomyces sp. CB01373]|uniref:prepilin peptidase n=1 Tax=Streptomyces sp. CB01373 TaxID=2020325 RepID=UPI000C28007B|nr:A24 family peptidase [Streptomyces sp. CB01373]PJM94091.1 prepilin peptidase [Streptomyces sp. CB01373]